jgi:hypothetical protein
MVFDYQITSPSKKANTDLAKSVIIGKVSFFVVSFFLFIFFSLRLLKKKKRKYENHCFIMTERSESIFAIQCWFFACFYNPIRNAKRKLLSKNNNIFLLVKTL